MTYIFFNDRTIRLSFHSASEGIMIRKPYIDPTESVEVEYPEGTVPYIKVWDTVVLLSNIPKNEDLLYET